MRKARLLYLTDKYEKKLISSTDIDMIKYSKKLDDTVYWIKVIFDLSEKEIVLDNNGYEAYIITCALLKAINKQCQELGWI